MSTWNPDLPLYTRMDVGSAICRTLPKAGEIGSTLARKCKMTHKRLLKITGGDASITINELVRIFQAMDCRFDLVVTPLALNEWDTKRSIAALEKKAWKKKASP